VVGSFFDIRNVIEHISKMLAFWIGFAFLPKAVVCLQALGLAEIAPLGAFP